MGPGLVAGQGRVVEPPPGEVVAGGVEVPGEEGEEEGEKRGVGVEKKKERKIDRSTLEFVSKREKKIFTIPTAPG